MSEAENNPFAAPKPVGDEPRSIGVLGILAIVVCCVGVTPVAFFVTCFAGVMVIDPLSGNDLFVLVLLGSLIAAVLAAVGVGRVLYVFMVGKKRID